MNKNDDNVASSQRSSSTLSDASNDASNDASSNEDGVFLHSGLFLHNGMTTIEQFIVVVNWFVNICFLFEMILKMIALGIIGHKGSYLKSKWNIFDAVLVFLWLMGIVITIFMTSATNGKESTNSSSTVHLYLNGFLMLRTMRTLKVLRMVENYPGVRHVVNTILLSMPRMLDVLVLLGFVWLIFSILGSKLWMGALRHCNDNQIIIPFSSLILITVLPFVIR